MDDYLPLFPLEVVLFPDMLLPLHIFEERYKQMIGECLQNKSAFGVLYVHDERVEEIGCTAEIRQVVRRYSDGRMDLVAVGLQRFRVAFFNTEKSYLRASIEPLADLQGGSDPSEEKALQALELYEQACRLISRNDPEELGPGPSFTGLAFKLASSLHLNNGIRQQILAARSEDERLETLSLHLSELIPRLTEAHKAAKHAGSNGRLRRD